MVLTMITMTSIDPSTFSLVNKSLEGSSRTLQKLEALVDSIKELENELKEAQYDYYRNVADMLSRVKEQMACFDAYGAIPHVLLIRSKIRAIENELKNHIQWSCREIGPLVNNDSGLDSEEIISTIDLQTLSQLYLVIDVLGVSFRKDLLERFAQLQLIPYEKLFKIGSKHAGLEFLDRRYAWFKRLLKAADDRVSSIFPASWNLPYHLFVEFSRRTTKHVADVLESAENDSTDAIAHVATLLKALKCILTFEAEMKASSDMQTRSFETQSADEGNGERRDFIAPPSITEAFDSFLGPYVQLERQGLEELMDKLMQEEEASMRDEAASTSSSVGRSKDPFGSSHKMFEFIKNSLKRCTAYSTGNTYLSLSKEFRICLQHYAENLRFRCPSPVSAKGGKPQYVITPSGEQLMSRIVTTGEYCIDTVPKLEEMMKKHISPSLCEEVDFSVQIDTFMDMVSFTYSIMTAGISERLEPAMRTLRTKTNVTSIDFVGDDSLYVKEINMVLNETIPRVRICMSGSYFQGFCMKLATTVLDKFLENLWLLKRISKTGGGQLLLDLQGVKTYLLRMPNSHLVQGEEPIVISKAYNNLVASKSILVERVLKLVCTEDDMMQENFKLLWPEGKQSDLDAVIAIKSSGNVVGDKIRETIKTVHSSGEGVNNNIVRGTSVLTGGIKDLFTGKMFEDVSTHSQTRDEDNHHHPHPHMGPHGVMGGSAATATKALGDMKNAFGSLNVFGTPSTKPSGNNHPVKRPGGPGGARG